MVTWKIDQQVQVSSFYREKYPDWKATTGTIVKIQDVKKFRASDLSKEDRAIYAAKYDSQEDYTLTSLIVKFDGVDTLVADLGIEAVPVAVPPPPKPSKKKT